MTYKQALKECKRVGTAHATGDALRAMYAGLLEVQHGGAAEQYYLGLQDYAQGTDTEIAEVARTLLRDRAKAWSVLMGDV